MVNSFQGRFVIYSGGIFLGATGCLVALFAPKLMVTVFSPQTNTREHMRRLLRGTDRSTHAGGSSDEASGVKSGNGRKASQDLTGKPMPLSQNTRKASMSLGIGTQSLASHGSVGSMANLSPRLGAAASVVNGIPTSNAHIAPAPATIYVQDGKQLAREHRDRIAGLVRVINNTAASGRITEFQEHIDKLQAFSSRFKILAPVKTRTGSIGVLNLEKGEKTEKDKFTAGSPTTKEITKTNVFPITEDV
ncbi:uncharacterized protein EV422DRAFT_240450 [Fimicolochytrium jonesii]|uniref:uncharacterized protein n=1 Tax=Fimicolochytrium jonesii TaxID=1396493 RepID=UPI0022FEC79D|nr:uncharacterized protein EV422DRAFT_240450 [Fimicolochytrium jonesii]KAI8824983.1 hypothetical protein EV422DRAFT_240450 [Fimicolochytrium jonesii]